MSASPAFDPSELVGERLRRVLAKFPNARRSGREWKAKCPVHDDNSPSLDIREEGGTILITCRVGCTDPKRGGSVERVLSAVGLEMSDLFAEPLTRVGSEPVARYDYRDEQGVLLMQVCRHPGKQFRQRRPIGLGGWEWSVKGVRVVPYRLPGLVAAPQAEAIFIAEGEKDCDTLHRLSMVATTNAGGAGKWKAEHSAPLKGRHVVILPDNDDPGRNHAEIVARSLSGIAASIRILHLPALPPKGDVSDWVTAGHAADELRALADAAPEWSPDAAVSLAPTASVTCMADISPRAVPWLWPGRLPAGMLAVLDGPPGLGKSSAVIDLIARITTGRPWPGSIDRHDPRDVVMLGAEDSPEHTIRPRLDAAKADCRRVHLLREIEGRMVRLPDDAAEIEKVIASTRASMLVIDPISAYIGQADLHRDNEVRAALTPLVVIAERTGCAVLMLRHLRKSTGGDALSRGLGSIAITALARAGLMLLPDPDDESREARILAWPKLSVGPQPPSLRWRFTPTGPDAPPRIVWDNAPCDLSADDILARQDAKPARMTVVGDAEDFLRSELGDGPVPSKQLERRAKDAGFGKSAYDRARGELGVTAERRGATWYTVLPPRTSARTSNPGLEDVEALEVDEVLAPPSRADFNSDEVGFGEEPQGPQEPQGQHAGGG